MLRRFCPFLFFLVVTVLAFTKAIFHGDFTLLIGGDVSSAYFPWFDVAAYWLKQGVVLLWDPYVYSGKPFMGEPQAGLFYPLNWLFMLLPARGGGMNLEGMQALLVLNYLLLGCFFYLFARSFDLSPWAAGVAGISFALGGFTATIYGYVNILSGYIWMPLALLFFRRALLTAGWRARARWIFYSALCLALTFLPGHHIPAVHTGLLMLFYTAFVILHGWKGSRWRSKIASIAVLASVSLTSALLTAFQWLPSAEWARQVYRWIGEGPPVQWGQKVPYAALEGAGNMSPQELLSLLFPFLSMQANLYVGCAVIFLALVGLLFAGGRESRFFALMAFVYLFMSWGRLSALHVWVNTFVPGAWFAREVFHYLIPFHACLALLAGWGLDYLVRGCGPAPDPKLRVFLRRAGWMMGILVVVSWSLVAAMHYLQKLTFDHPFVTSVGGFATYLSVLGILLFLLQTGRITPPTFRTLAVALIVVDLASQVSASIPGKQYPAEAQSEFVQNRWRKSRAAEFLQAKREHEGEFFRVDDPSNIFPPNYGDVWRLHATMGHGATALVDYFAFRGAGWGPGSNATALLNVRYFPSRIPVAGMKKVFEESEGEAIYLNPRAVPRAFVASRYRSFSSGGEILTWLQSPLMCPSETVLILRQDLESLPSRFRAAARNDDEGIHVGILSYRTAAQREAERTADAQMRYQLHLFQAPWGWGPGDEIALSVRPERPQNCYLILTFYPDASGPSELLLSLEGPGAPARIPVALPGCAPASGGCEDLRQAVVDLGPMAAEAYRLSLTKTAECRARIDSLRISGRAPDPEEEGPGTVQITSHTPNRIRMTAELRRPSFVLVSEVLYAGWEAFVDGRPAPLLPGDYILRAIPVPEGRHQVELRFRPKSLRWGLSVSLVSIGVFTGVLFATRLKRL